MRTLFGLFEFRVVVTFIARVFSRRQVGFLSLLRYPVKRLENRTWSELDTVGYERAPGYTATFANLHPSTDDAAFEDTVWAYCHVVEEVRITQDGRGANSAVCPNGGCNNLRLLVYLS